MRSEPGDGHGCAEHPADDQPPRSDPPVDPPRDLRGDEDADGLRERHQSAVERVEAAQALEVQREHEQQADEARHAERHDQVGGGEEPVAQQAEGEHRLRAVGLDPHEEAEREHAADAEHDDDRVVPARHGGLR